MNDFELQALQRRVASLQEAEAKKWSECEAVQEALRQCDRADPTSEQNRRAGREASEALHAWVAARREREAAVREMMRCAKRNAGLIPNDDD